MISERVCVERVVCRDGRVFVQCNKDVGGARGTVGRGDWSVAGDREARREVKAKPGHLTALFAWLLILRPTILSNSAATANGQRVSGQRSRRDGHGREAWPTCGCGGAAILSGPNLVCRRLHSGRA